MYLWVKALHVVAIVAWMAGMLYLPRLFVYHAQSEAGSPQSATFKIMEGRLLRIIMGPAMVIVWLSGLWLAYDAGFFHSGWLHAKLALVLVMSGLHGFFAKCVRDFNGDQNRLSGRSFRILNEVPTLLLIGVVILVIVKPF
jgi:protoporphyrinogen IX oxidase